MSLEPIEERVLEEGRFIAERGATVREAAARFHVSKSTVHKDLVERLPRLAPALQFDNAWVDPAPEGTPLLEPEESLREVRRIYLGE